MLVHLVARPMAGSSHIPATGLHLLADGLRSAGATVLEDIWPVPGSDLATSVGACTAELCGQWQARPPDIVHSVGVAATIAAIKAGGSAPIVATFDEKPYSASVERRLAERLTAVVPLSLTERDRWRHLGVRTLWGGSFPFPIPVPDPDACAAPTGEIVALSGGPDLDLILSSMPHWNGRLIVATRLTPERLTAVRARALALGVWDRIAFRPGLRGSDRDAMWSRAAVVVAGLDGSRHGAYVLEAAAHGVSAIALAEDAHVDHVVPRATGVLVEPTADHGTLGRAVAATVSDSFGLRAMGTSALVRIRTLHSGELAGRRLVSLYEQVLQEADRSERPGVAPRSEPCMRSDADRNALALEHLALARQLAGWYSGRGQSREDLVQVASLGLVRAAERFDPSHGKEFHSFAIPTILGELRKHFRDHAWAVRVPRGLQETTLQVQRASEEMRQSLGHEATAADLAEQLGLVEEEVLLAQRAEGEARVPHSLTQPLGDAGSVADLVGESDPSLDLIELSHDVRAALARLPEREQRILLMRFFGERTQSEIAERLGISQVHVSRVLSRTLAAVRDHVLEDVALPTSWDQGAAPTIPRPRPPSYERSAQSDQTSSQ